MDNNTDLLNIAVTSAPYRCRHKLCAGIFKLGVVAAKGYFCGDIGISCHIYKASRCTRFTNLIKKVKNSTYKMQVSRLDKLLEFLKNEPEDEFLKYALATEYLRLNDTGKALAYYEDLVNNHPNYVGTYYHLGKLYDALNRKADAESTYEKGMKVAREKRDNHAFSELKVVYDELIGLYDD